MRVVPIILAAVCALGVSGLSAPARAQWNGYEGGDGWRRQEWRERQWQRQRWREHEWREREWRERQLRSYAPPPGFYTPPPAYYVRPPVPYYRRY